MNEILEAKLRNAWCKRVRRGNVAACWLWTGAVSSNGYGCMNAQYGGERINTAPHIVAYWMHNGPLLPDTCVCHSCDNPLCCNPRHLFLGSKRRNMQDCAAKARVKGQKLSKRDAAAIFQSALTQRELSAYFGVSKDTIKQIKQRKTHYLATEGLVRGVWRLPPSP